MSKHPWHKRYHGDALGGYMGLTLEERGAYTTCLDLIYERGGPLPFTTPAEQIWLAGWLGVSARLTRSIIAKLVAKGKFQIIGGALVNGRATAELGRQNHLSEVRIEAGRAAGIASGKARKGTNGDARKGTNEDAQHPSLANGSGQVQGSKTSGTLDETVLGASEINGLAEPKLNRVRVRKEERKDSLSVGSNEPTAIERDLDLWAGDPEGEFWNLASALEKRGVARSRLGQLIKLHDGDYKILGPVIRAIARAKDPAAYVSGVIRNCKADAEPKRARASPTAASDVPDFVRAAIAEGAFPERDGPRNWRICGYIYDPHGNEIGF